jgi:hypothetical protein
VEGFCVNACRFLFWNTLRISAWHGTQMRKLWKFQNCLLSRPSTWFSNLLGALQDVASPIICGPTARVPINNVSFWDSNALLVSLRPKLEAHQHKRERQPPSVLPSQHLCCKFGGKSGHSFWMCYNKRKTIWRVKALPPSRGRTQQQGKKSG